MLGTVSLLALAALTSSFMTTVTPAVFAQPHPNAETIKKICGDTAVSFKKGTCFYPITYDCSGIPGSIPDGSGFCIDPVILPPDNIVGVAQLVCNQGGDPTQVTHDKCLGKPTGPTRQ
jgi:hypothetical protein